MCNAILFTLQFQDVVWQSWQSPMKQHTAINVRTFISYTFGQYILRHVLARKFGEPIYVSADLITLYHIYLVKLVLCTAARGVTRIGSTCLEGNMEIRSALIVEIGIRLVVGVYARIASTFNASSDV